MLDFVLYAAKDTKTGKLVSNITNPSHKFWQRRGDCEKAIVHANKTGRSLELVVLKVTEFDLSKD